MITKHVSGFDESDERLMVGGLSSADPSKGDPSRCRLMTLPLWNHSQRHSLLRVKEAAGQGIRLGRTLMGTPSRDQKVELLIGMTLECHPA